MARLTGVEASKEKRWYQTTSRISTEESLTKDCVVCEGSVVYEGNSLLFLIRMSNDYWCVNNAEKVSKNQHGYQLQCQQDIFLNISVIAPNC